jgi:Domain of unknown function (DUF5666)
MTPRPAKTRTRSRLRNMDTLAYNQPEDGRATVPETAEEGRLPRRPRPRYLNKKSLVLTAAVTCAAGFYAGVRVEKGQVNGSTSSTGTALAALASRFRGAAGAAGGTGSAAAARGAGAAGGAGAGSGTAFGTVASINGHTLDVTEATNGNTVKVRLTSATKLTKSLGVSRSALHPGDTVIVRGLSGSGGTISAASVSDSGTGSAGGGLSRGGTGSGGGKGSGLSSLFSSGG